MLFGALSGLSSAFIWAASSLAVKAQAGRIDTLSFNVFRLIVGAIFFFLLLPFVGGLDALLALPATTYLALALSVMVGVGVGDSVYFWSLTKIGASRAMPLSGIYPLFTWVLAIPILGEPITPMALMGTTLILLSLYLLAPESAAKTGEANDFMIAADDKVAAEFNHVDSSRRNGGFVAASLLKLPTAQLATAAAVFAALMWAVSTTLLRMGIRDETNAVVVNAFRLPVGALALFAVLHRLKGTAAWRGYDRPALPGLIILAVFSTGIGSLLWVLSVQFAGAARAALFSTTSPLLGIPLAVIFLREKVTLRVAAGTLLTVLGVWLVLM